MRLFERFTVWSGGQTGVDRAALDAALSLGIPHGGWCPKGRLSEAGPIPEHYLLTEHASAKYVPRTKQNILDTDGTLVLGWGSEGVQQSGTALTLSYAKQQNKPVKYVDLKLILLDPVGVVDVKVKHVSRWVVDEEIYFLNVGGPRETKVPGIQQLAMYFLISVFDHVTKQRP